MAKLSARVEHALGAKEAEARLRAATEEHRSKIGPFVSSIDWSNGVATVVGKGFHARVIVGERDIVIEADLGLPSSLFPLKVKREAETWLGRLLG